MEFKEIFKGMFAFLILIINAIACWIIGTTTWRYASIIDNNTIEWTIKLGIILITAIAIFLVPILITLGANISIKNVLKGILTMWISTIALKILLGTAWTIVELFTTTSFIVNLVLKIGIFLIIFLFVFFLPNVIMLQPEETG